MLGSAASSLLSPSLFSPHPGSGTRCISSPNLLLPFLLPLLDGHSPHSTHLRVLSPSSPLLSEGDPLLLHFQPHALAAPSTEGTSSKTTGVSRLFPKSSSLGEVFMDASHLVLHLNTDRRILRFGYRPGGTSHVLWLAQCRGVPVSPGVLHGVPMPSLMGRAAPSPPAPQGAPQPQPALQDPGHQCVTQVAACRKDGGGFPPFY